MAATKRKAPRKAASRKSSAKRTRSSKPKTSFEFTSHLFPNGAKVEAYPSSEVAVERNIGREPIGDPAGSATVSKDGALEFTGLKPGEYQAVAEVETSALGGGAVEKVWRYMAFTVS